MRPVTARGFRDVLPAEAAERDAVSRAIADEFASWGYGLVETPVAEDLAALEAAAGPLQGTAFRLIDLDGRLLALRPDMTVPIARLVASRLSGVAGPHRFRYAAEVFREHESLRGQARQFSQAGIELIGGEGPAADAEVISLLVAALEAAKLPEFTVAIGTVAVLHAIVAAADAPAAWGDAVLAAAHERNLVGLDVLAREASAPAVARALSAVPRIRGGREAIVACREATAGLGCEAALDQLDEAWTLLEASGADSRVLVDFSVMRSFDYYTGLVLEAYAPGLGLPLAGGGRYDGVLAAFDAPAPAVGFALGLERLMIALMEQQAPVERAPGSTRCSAATRRLRSRPPACCAPQAGASRSRSARASSCVREAERLGAAEALLARAGLPAVRLDRAGEPATRSRTPRRIRPRRRGPSPCRARRRWEVSVRDRAS